MTVPSANHGKASIMPSDIQAWVASLELAPATVGVAHGIVSTVMKLAIRDRRLPSNPCEGTKLPKVHRKQIVPLTTEQMPSDRDSTARSAALLLQYASLLIRHGESPKTVQARLGHASAVETLVTYSHLWPDSDDRTREAIDSVLGPTADANRAVEIKAQPKWVGADELACKPDSVPHRPRAERRRPSIWALRRRVPQAAYPQARASSPRTPAQPHTRCGLLALLRVGFTEPSRSPGMLVRSYRTVSPLPPACRRRSVLCGTVPRVTSDCR